MNVLLRAFRTPALVESGGFLGQQVEARLRWRPFPGNTILDVGFAHTFLGRFARSAPNATREGDPSYVYTQIGFEI